MPEVEVTMIFCLKLNDMNRK